MSSTKQRRGNAKACLTRAVEFLASITDSTTLEMLEIRLSRVVEAWGEFCSMHYECLKEAKDEEAADLENEFGLYETKYFQAHSGLKRAMRVLKATMNVSSEPVSESLANQVDLSVGTCSKIKLPTIDVPPFDGDYKNWHSFRDLFLGSVDTKPNLTPTHKLYYLKSFLRGSAADLIQHIKLSDANYPEAWDKLERRYDRVNLVVNSFVQTFMTLPSVSVPNVQTLRKLTDGADEVIRGLNALEKNTRDPWLIHIILNKVDSETKHAWAEEVGTREDLLITELIDFLERRCDALESCQPLPRNPKSCGKQSGRIQSHVASTLESKNRCPKCKNDHKLTQCSQFLSLDLVTRRQFTKEHSLCFNCLRSGHTSNNCRSSFRCRVCKARHHSLVHQVNSNETNQIASAIPDSNNSFPSSSTSSSQHSNSLNLEPISNAAAVIISNPSLSYRFRKQTVLPTIIAKVQNIQGHFTHCRILLDTGSQSSFVTESLTQRLGLPRKHARIPVLGLSSSEAGHTRGCVTLTLFSRFNSTQLTVDAFVLGKLTSDLPSTSFDASTWEHIQNLDLADPSFNVSGAIDVLLGADRVWSILKADQVRGLQGQPIAQNTSFGWIISGELFEYNNSKTLSSFHSVVDVDYLLQRFWELEEVTPHKALDTLNDPAEKHFRQNFSRAADGKYVVSLPFKTSMPNFSDTLQSAISRLRSMERRFRTNPNLHRQYSQFMREYIELGHMTLIPHESIPLNPSKQFYLPHHAVLKPESSSTKLRVVFDGSAKDSSGQSLNSHLMVGPPIQRNLIGVCLRFRQHQYVFTADIVKMFRQIWVRDQDVDYQRIVWRQNESEPIQHFHLKTVTYGTASAPFLSVRVLQQLAEDYQLKYPKAASVLLNDVYVDDVMTGTNSIDSLLELQSELVALLSEARLQLRKWSSNSWAVLASQNSDDCEYSFVDPERASSLVKVLGMFWNPAADVLSYRLNLSDNDLSLSRRTLLSEIASIFDPLGLLAPSVIVVKIMFQSLWSADLNLKWDSSLPLDIQNKWLTFREQLPSLEKVQIPRNVFSSEEFIELHGFSDASALAYSAVVYAVSKTSAGVNITIIAAKTKVAPLKPISIPRLELCGALLLARVISLVKTSITAKITRTVAWCDSEIVLHWLSSPPRRWTTFVANRTAAILETIPRYSWRHVPSESNPADCASRGVLPSDLINHSLWWTGPSWLSLSEEHWPKSTLSFNLSSSEPVTLEERSVVRHVLVTSFDNHVLDHLIEKYSSWYRLQVFVALLLRWPSKTVRVRHASRCAEMRNAKNTLLKFVQHKAFGNDISYLSKHNELPAKSKLLRYSPFVDKDGLLRIGGRIKNATVSFNIKHPIILPKNSNISALIILDIHNCYMHSGISETFAFVRQQFWILGSRNIIRRIIHQCNACFKQRKLTNQQAMGDLPSGRVQPTRPFLNTGVDYAGPLTMKLSRCRKAKTSKAYIALFVCLSTKALHLELVSDLTTEAFLAAFRRFVSRRGKCANVYSDNGTNFHGARRCLSEMHKLVLKQPHNDSIAAALAKDNITWHFIPPSAPNFGGLWEAGVKSVKLHLRRVIGHSVLTFEDLCTILTQIEAVLNSRPLCPISDFDLDPLTPAHSLIGEPLTALPEPDYLNTPINRLSHWCQLQNMVQGFWKRWHMEYLTTLQERPKWQRCTTNLKPGDLVVIKEPHLPPTRWLLGRVESVHPGADKLVRVATVKTASTTLVRPISKLALLPRS